ncbi:hypothetical protein R3P38DRAFT_2697166 [Favolaschia claudopus]|uniref:Uncharacterized protein n=1 Tax=Favolaschia claudopus TaxID=2862362 RepID=A0AAW0CI63_9AGAR
MSHTSPASYLVWSIMSVILFAFLVFHMWSFDRFRCLRWSSSGTFKRVMTYSYLLAVPLIVTYALGFAIIKYRQGFIAVGGVAIPKPYPLWPDSARSAIFPLMLTFAFAWSLEMITHLEELCFWFFVVKSTEPQDWFRSAYFRIWIVGSCAAIVYMPVVTILARRDPLVCEAHTFLGGSAGSLTLTLAFTPILWAFPNFLAGLKAAGVDSATIVRLTKFHELNMIRVLFRFVFLVPLFILGVDGVRPHKYINESMVWTDFLTMISAVGCCISSALTLVIFFPRSVEDEIAAKDAAREKRRSRVYSHSLAPSGRRTSSLTAAQEWDMPITASEAAHMNANAEYPASAGTGFDLEQQQQQQYAGQQRPYNFLPSIDEHTAEAELDGSAFISSPQMAHKEGHYDRARDVNMQDMASVGSASASGSMRKIYLHRRPSGVSPLVHNFRSPIDLGEG